MHVLSLNALKERENFVKFYTFATKHKVNVLQRIMKLIKQLCFLFAKVSHY